MTSQPVTPAPDMLNSWKEIARYLDRGVRTVQRWEVELALPVRRPHGHGRSAVLALRSELDTWLRGCAKVKLTGAAGSLSTDKLSDAPMIYNLEALPATAVLIQDSRRLRSDARDARAQLRHAVFQLRQSLGKMMVAPPPRCALNGAARREAKKAFIGLG